MKIAALKEQFVTDAKGKRMGVLLDLKTYAQMCEAQEELADIQAYDAARPKDPRAHHGTAAVFFESVSSPAGTCTTWRRARDCQRFA